MASESRDRMTKDVYCKTGSLERNELLKKRDKFRRRDVKNPQFQMAFQSRLESEAPV